MINNLVLAYGSAQYVAGWLHGHDQHALMNQVDQIHLKAKLKDVKVLEPAESISPVQSARRAVICDIGSLRKREACQSANALVDRLLVQLDGGQR